MASVFRRKAISRLWPALSNLALVVMGSQLWALPCLAQDRQSPPATTGSDAGAETTDIIVTANKREQKLQDVGLAVNVVSGQALQTQHIASMADVATRINGLSYATSARNTPVYTLRGVGFYESSLGAYPAVSIYTDEVPLPFSALTTHSAYDLERIEVLKGPQGTLFGESSTAGAINFITAKPTRTLSYGGQISYGRFNEVDIDAFLSGPVSDALSVRVAGRVERADGWQISNSRPNDRNGKVENYMGRFLADFQPTDTVRFQLDVNGWKDQSQPQALQYSGFLPTNAILSPVILASPFSPETPRAADWTPGIYFTDNSLWQISLRGDVNITDGLRLTSVTSYLKYSSSIGSDSDGLPSAAYDTPLNSGTVNSFFQELRLSNINPQHLTWIVGANFEKTNVQQINDGYFPDSSTTATLQAFTGYFIHAAHASSSERIKNYAFYGNAEYKITDMLTVKGGLRYTDSRNVGTGCNASINNDPLDSGGFFYDVLLGGAFGSYQQGACFIINDLGRPVNGVAPGAPGEYSETLHEHNLSWRAGLDWKPDQHVLIYANIARGYKAGSFPALSASSFTSYRPVVQETVLSYEAGVKAQMLDGRLDVEGAGFYYDYKNKQLLAKLSSNVFGILDVLQNIPKSTVWGFELEMTARPIRSFSIAGSFSYTKAKIDKFSGINGVGVEGDFSGTPIPFTPEYQFRISPEFTFQVGSGAKANIGASLSYRSRAITVVGGLTNYPGASPAGKPLSGIPAYALLDAHAGVTFDDGRMTVSVFGKNLTNKYYWDNVVTSSDTLARTAGRPITYGLSLAYKY